MKAPLEIDAYLYIVRFFPRYAGLFGVFFLLCFFFSFNILLCSTVRLETFVPLFIFIFVHRHQSVISSHC